MDAAPARKQRDISGRKVTKIVTPNGKPAPRGYSPLTGAPIPAGRPKGVPNKVTQSIREAIEMATREVMDSKGKKGLAAWLVERAHGNVQDRQIFAGLVAKALPLQVNASVNGGITLNLGWLQQRAIGTATAQLSGNAPQVIDVTPKKQDVHLTASLTPEGAIELTPVREPGKSVAADPPPPIESGSGG